MPEELTRLRWRRVWLLVGWVLVFLSIFVSLNSSGLPVISNNFNDKLIHMTGYGCLMLWFAQIYHCLRPRWTAAVLLVLMGVVLEFIQGLSGIRVFEVADMIANTIGVAIGLVLASVGLDNLLAWFERRIIFRHP